MATRILERDGEWDGRHVLASLRMAAESRLEVLRRVADLARTPGSGIDPDAVVRALEAREAEGTTAIEGSAAVPHASVEGLEAPMLLDVTLEEPVRWGEGGTVDRCLVILVPPGRHREHLELCGEAARRLVGEAGAGTAPREGFFDSPRGRI